MAASSSGDLPDESGSTRSNGRLDRYSDQWEEETVSIRRLPDEDNSVREVRISCPDAHGLGCDITRMLLDFGLRILHGDISTDGRWCFLIFKVALTSGVGQHWKLLQHRLEKLCAPKHTWAHLTRRASSMKDYYEQAFMLQVTSSDRIGVLHDLMNTLWECDVVMFKAHITTSPSKEVCDMFWIYDNRGQLPEASRALEICDKVKGTLHKKNVECVILPAPADTCDSDSTSNLIKRSACKDMMNGASSLRHIVGHKKKAGGVGQAAAHLVQKDEYGGNEDVQISIDNYSSGSYTLVTLMCNDRKGLTYDLMRTLFDMNIRTAYGKISVKDNDTCEIDLFVQEIDGSRITDSDMLDELRQRMRQAVALPVRISIKDVYDATCTELLVTAYMDSGCRGRPRVTYDVTAALNGLGLCVFMADVYHEPDTEMEAGERPQELHRFIVHFPDGKPVSSEDQKAAVYHYVRGFMMGTVAKDTRPAYKHMDSTTPPAYKHMGQAQPPSVSTAS